MMNTALTTVAYVGLLEEYRFYVREDHAISGNAASDLTPVLSRARFYPGTDQVYAADTSNFKQDIAATDALRTGSYSKTLTFTLSTTNP